MAETVDTSSNETRDMRRLLPPKKRLIDFFRTKTFVYSSIGFLVLIGIFVFLYNSVFVNFTVPETLIDIDAGTSLDSAIKQLKSSSIISSRQGVILSALVQLVEGERGLQQGIYRFTGEESLYTIAERLLNAEYKIEPVKVTIPEGFTRLQMSEVLSRALPRFSARDFLAKTDNLEGYLFPDTYYFLPHTDTDQVIAKLQLTFTKKIASLATDIASFGKPLSDVITMASILEGEARQTETRRVVSGILWKRLKEGMPLQVDTTFVYGIGKNSFDLTSEDLKTDGPYNSYTRKGLPPTPISNPGLDAIAAAVHPTNTKYLYFLTGSDGTMYYAKTFDQHVLNKKRYLK